jgi:hypothetical protein
MPYTIVKIAGLTQSSSRAVAFLSNEDLRLDAENVYAAMQPATAMARTKQRKELLTRFDFWINGGHKNNWFHGWPNDTDCKACFTFKWKNRNVDQRFYGFLCNPLPMTNPRFQLCLLHSHAQKFEWNTDDRHLKMAIKLSGTTEVLSAICQFYQFGL